MSDDPTRPAGFQGRIARTREESQPHYAPRRATPAGAPNVVVIYMDDLGYSDIGCFGGEIATPHIDALAARGLRFNHYTTHPICSPARAALLTGRNAHSVGTGWLANNSAGFPGYTGDIPLQAPTLAETFRAGGYTTLGIGKWHNCADSVTPNDTWPTFRGFDRFYGFMEGETNYFAPARLMINNSVAPVDEYPPDYYSTDDFTTQAIRLWTQARNEDAARPVLLYLAFNAVHGPLQAKPEDLAKYAGRYDIGWDALREQRLVRQKAMGLVPQDAVLSPRDPMCPDWATAAPEVRSLYARHMEPYAALLDCVDQNVGRLVAFLRAAGELDNTIVVFSSDNGGTGAGGPHGTVYFERRFAGLPAQPLQSELGNAHLLGTVRSAGLYPMGWGQLSNTPFPSYKTFTGAGGRRVSFVISWPAGIGDHGAIRRNFAHVTDVMPTLMDLAGVKPMETIRGEKAWAMHGRSFAPALRDPAAPTRTEQYYECWANRAYWRDGWVAVSPQIRGKPIDFDRWTLHRQATDFSESTDLSGQYPEKLKELAEAFDRDAWANWVYPLDNRTPIQKFNEASERASTQATRRRFLTGGQTVHRSVLMPYISDRHFAIELEIEQRAGDEGVLFAIGDPIAGIVLYIETGELRLTYNGFGEFHRLGPLPIAAGVQRVRLEYEALGGRKGRGRLVAEPVGAEVTGPGGASAAISTATTAAAATDWGDLSPSLRNGFHEGLDIGLDRRAPVDWDLQQRRGAFRYSGQIRWLEVDPGAKAGTVPT